MEGEWFDALTFLVGRSLGRRHLGGVLAAVGLGMMIQGTAAKKKKRKKCKTGTVRCGRACVNTKTNTQHCGGCDTACEAGETCDNGQCAAACSPACESGRQCVAGRCTCAADAQCEFFQDPHGNWCVDNPPGQPAIGMCGCLSGQAVCAPGEACSSCCDATACTGGDPGSEFVCAEVPANAYWSRECCLPTGAECGIRDDFCCSRRCASGQCECAPAGSACRSNSGCCSGACLVSSGKCA